MPELEGEVLKNRDPEEYYTSDEGEVSGSGLNMWDFWGEVLALFCRSDRRCQGVRPSEPPKQRKLRRCCRLADRSRAHVFLRLVVIEARTNPC